MSAANRDIQAEDLAISGQRVHVWTGGSGPALLLLHAAWGDAEMSWSRVWSDLSRSFRVIAPDLPGFGASAPLHHPSLAANANVLRGLLDALKVDRAVVAGNSFGAGVAIAFASSFPVLTRSLVLVNGGSLPAAPRFLKNVITLPGLGAAFRALMRSMTYSRRVLRGAFVDPSRLPPSFLGTIEDNAGRYSRIVFDTWLHQVKPQRPPAVPTILLWGAQDTIGTLQYARRTQRWIPGSELRFIEGAGHMPQVEKPEVFIAEMQTMRGE